ncbi:hypothetical protein V500_02977 [Pseudogymnoascus sp. VKM F-4518 (FW-2643)]|nr:hypothetical protein V500_02977 [Pseudogymnoascus sp. VKM F-4518 (FW-2643)]
MSVRRVKWEANEKLQMKRLFRSHPLKPASYIENLFNAGKPKDQHRSLNAIKFRVSSLKKEWYRRWRKERSSGVIALPTQSLTSYAEGIVPTAPGSSTTSLFNNEYAWSAPDMGIFIPLHPLLKNDQLSPSNMYTEGGGLPAFDLVEETVGLAQEERQDEDEEAFRRHMVSFEMRSISPEGAK